jgi:hypothetical protein
VAEGQRLEAQPSSEIVGPKILAQEKIFMADAVKALPVNARLIGSNHPSLERNGVMVMTNLLRPFMDPEEKAYSVAGSMAEVAFMFP